VNFSQLHEDRALAKRVAAGGSDAFEAFFREYFPRLFRFTLTRVNGDAELAEEIVQRTMCRVVRKMGSYRGEALLFTWLCQICRNEMAAVFKQRGLAESQSLPLEDHPAIRAGANPGRAGTIRSTDSRIPARQVCDRPRNEIHPRLHCRRNWRAPLHQLQGSGINT